MILVLEGPRNQIWLIGAFFHGDKLARIRFGEGLYMPASLILPHTKHVLFACLSVHELDVRMLSPSVQG